MNRRSQAILAKLAALNRQAIVRATRTVREDLPGVRCNGHVPRIWPSPSAPASKVHKGELVPVSWKRSH